MLKADIDLLRPYTCAHIYRPRSGVRRTERILYITSAHDYLTIAAVRSTLLPTRAPEGIGSDIPTLRRRSGNVPAGDAVITSQHYEETVMKWIRLAAIAVTLAGGFALTARPALAAAADECTAMPMPCDAGNWDQVMADANADCADRGYTCYSNLTCSAYESCGQYYINDENWACKMC